MQRQFGHDVWSSAGNPLTVYTYWLRGWTAGRSSGEGAALTVTSGGDESVRLRQAGAMSHPAHGGTLLRSLRQAHGWTQNDLGRDSGVSVRTIRGLERGEIQRPQLATLQQLALAMELRAPEQAEFMHAWATPPQPGYDRLLVDPTLSEMEQIDAITRSVLGAYRVISQN